MKLFKRTAALTVLLFIGSYGIARAASISQLDFSVQDGMNTAYVYDISSTAGTPVYATMGWRFDLYKDLTGDGPTGDDTSIWNSLSPTPGSASWSLPGQWSAAKLSLTTVSDYVYVRVFDAAGNWVNLNANAASTGNTVQNGSWQVADAGDGTALLYFDSSNINGAVDWVAVPEPGTLALMGLGAVVLALRKRRQARKS